MNQLCSKLPSVPSSFFFFSCLSFGVFVKVNNHELAVFFNYLVKYVWRLHLMTFTLKSSNLGILCFFSIVHYINEFSARFECAIVMHN